MAGPTAYRTEWGIFVSASAGTGSLTITDSGAPPSMRVCGVACGGSATADVITVYSGATNGYSSIGTPFYSGIGSTAGALAALNLGAIVRLVGPITVNFVGGTNGVCYIYTPSQNA